MRDEDSFDACCRCSERDQGPECRPHLFRFHVLDCPGRFPVDRRCRHQRHQGIMQWPLPWPHCVIMRHFASYTLSCRRRPCQCNCKAGGGAGSASKTVDAVHRCWEHIRLVPWRPVPTPCVHRVIMKARCSHHCPNGAKTPLDLPRTPRDAQDDTGANCVHHSKQDTGAHPRSSAKPLESHRSSGFTHAGAHAHLLKAPEDAR